MNNQIKCPICGSSSGVHTHVDAVQYYDYNGKVCGYDFVDEHPSVCCNSCGNIIGRKNGDDIKIWKHGRKKY